MKNLAYPIWEDLGRFGKTWEDMGRHGKTWEDKGRFGKTRENLGRFGKTLYYMNYFGKRITRKIMFCQMLKNYNLFRIGTSSDLKPHINLKKRIVTAVTNSAGTVFNI